MGLNSVPVNTKLQNRTTLLLKHLLTGATFVLLILVLILSGTQIYGYLRYKAFPSDLKFLISSFPSSRFLRGTLTGHLDSVTSITISNDGQFLASGSQDKTIKLWNLRTGELLRSFYGHSSAIESIAISPDRHILISGSEHDGIKVWNLSTGEVLCSFSQDSSFDAVRSVTISPDGKILVAGISGLIGGEVRIWDLSTNKLLHNLTGNISQSSISAPVRISAPVYATAISKDGRTLASGGVDEEIKLWNLHAAQLKETLSSVYLSDDPYVYLSDDPYKQYTTSISFSPNGQLLASGSGDETIKLWNLHTKVLRTFFGNSDSVNSIAFSPDGKLLASGSADGTIKLWNPSTGELRQTLIGHSASVNSIAFSPDGKTLVSGSKDKTIKIWQLD